jgi:hypothetical protein
MFNKLKKKKFDLKLAYDFLVCFMVIICFFLEYDIIEEKIGYDFPYIRLFYAVTIFLTWYRMS